VTQLIVGFIRGKKNSASETAHNTTASVLTTAGVPTDNIAATAATDEEPSIGVPTDSIIAALAGDKQAALNSNFLLFLANRTISRAFGTVCCLSVVCQSVVCPSVTFCIVAKRYVLAKNCLKE